MRILVKNCIIIGVNSLGYTLGDVVDSLGRAGLWYFDDNDILVQIFSKGHQNTISVIGEKARGSREIRCKTLGIEGSAYIENIYFEWHYKQGYLLIKKDDRLYLCFATPERNVPVLGYETEQDFGDSIIKMQFTKKGYVLSLIKNTLSKGDYEFGSVYNNMHSDCMYFGEYDADCIKLYDYIDGRRYLIARFRNDIKLEFCREIEFLSYNGNCILKD